MSISNMSGSHIHEVDQPSPAKCLRHNNWPTQSVIASSSGDGPDILMDWQIGKSLQDCLRVLLSQHHLCDVRFDFPDEEATSLEAHKLILAARSPVFEAMLYGLAGEKDDYAVIKITDTRSCVFSALLQFVYTDSTEPEEEFALELLHLSHKYRLQSLTEWCCAHLVKQLSVQNVLICLQSAVLLDLPLFQEHCLMYVDKDAKKILCSEEFPKISQETLNLVLQRDSLRIPEIYVYRAALKWTKTRCQEQKLEPSEENLRKILGSTVRLIRFPLMQAVEVSKEVVPDKVLTKDEQLEVLLHITCPALHPTIYNSSDRDVVTSNWLLKGTKSISKCSSEFPQTVRQTVLVQTDEVRHLEGFACKLRVNSLTSLKVEGKVVLTCSSDEIVRPQECTDFSTKKSLPMDTLHVLFSAPMVIKPGKDYILDMNFHLHHITLFKPADMQHGHIVFHGNKVKSCTNLPKSCLEGFLMYASP